MKILQVCKKFPWPPRDGESIAIFNLTQGFARAGHEVTVLGMNTPKHRFDPGFIPEYIKQMARFYAIDVNTAIQPIPALLNLLTANSYNLERFFSRDFKEGLYGLIRDESFDLIQLEGLYLAPYFNAIRKASRAPVVLRAHNVEFEIWEKLARLESKRWRRWYLDLLARRLRKFETDSLNVFSAIVPISPTDALKFRELGATVPIHTCPTGMSVSDYAQFSTPGDQNSIGYLGALDWTANREGVDWFLNHCWPALRMAQPGLTLHIAGRNAPPAWLGRRLEGVEFAGEIEDAKAFLSRHRVIILPLLSGSGIRIKLLEALAMAKPVVATSQAAEGIAIEPGRHVLIADTPEAFSEAVLRFIRNPDLAQSCGKEGQKLVSEQYDQEKLVYELLEFYTSQILQ